MAQAQRFGVALGAIDLERLIRFLHYELRALSAYCDDYFGHGWFSYDPSCLCRGVFVLGIPKKSSIAPNTIRIARLIASQSVLLGS
jgi:hypothetical protein